MKKAFSKILLIFILAVILGAAYFIWQAIAAKKNQGPTVKAPEIIVITQGDHKIVKNLTDGYQVTIPKTWNVEKPTTKSEPISFYSPETNQQISSGSVEYGCKIETSISPKVISIEDLQKDNKEELSWYSVERNEYSVINVAGYQAVKNIFEAAETGYSIGIYLPTKNRLYSFIMYVAPQDIKTCTEYMDNFLKTVVIK